MHFIFELILLDKTLTIYELNVNGMTYCVTCEDECMEHFKLNENDAPWMRVSVCVQWLIDVFVKWADFSQRSMIVTSTCIFMQCMSVCVCVVVCVCHQLFDMRSKLYSENVIQKIATIQFLPYTSRDEWSTKQTNNFTHTQAHSLCRAPSLMSQDQRLAYMCESMWCKCGWNTVYTCMHTRTHIQW